MKTGLRLITSQVTKMLSPTEKNRLKKHVSLETQRASEVFDALGDPNRCKLFRVFAHKPGLNVSDAASVLDLSLPLASQHLKVLETKNLLIRSKTGKEVFYTINKDDPLVRAIISAID